MGQQAVLQNRLGVGGSGSPLLPLLHRHIMSYVAVPFIQGITIIWGNLSFQSADKRTDVTRENTALNQSRRSELSKPSRRGTSLVSSRSARVRDGEGKVIPQSFLGVPGVTDLSR